MIKIYFDVLTEPIPKLYETLMKRVIRKAVSEHYPDHKFEVNVTITVPEAIDTYEISAPATVNVSDDTLTLSNAADAIVLKIVLPDGALLEDASATMDVAAKWIWPSLLTWILGIFAALMCVVLWIAV